MNAYQKRRSALYSAYSLWPQAGDGCAYCGVYAESYDHVPPLSFVHSLGLSHFEDAGIRLWLVPACRECNSLLSPCHHETVFKRKKLIKTKLRTRYGKFLGSAPWTENELDELGWNLRTIVESGANIGEWIRRRLAW